jgi:hypothetical protein
LAFLGQSDPNLAKLPTTWLLCYVHQKVAPPEIYTAALYVDWMNISYANASTPANTVTTPTTAKARLTNSAVVAAPARWKLLLPGAANYEAFSVVGHCLFALLAGLLGIVVARRYQARQDAVRFDH